MVLTYRMTEDAIVQLYVQLLRRVAKIQFP